MSAHATSTTLTRPDPAAPVPPGLPAGGDAPPPRDLEEHLARARLHRRLLRDFARVALEDGGQEVGPLLQRACVLAARATGIRRTKVLRHRPEMGDLLMVAGVGWRDGVVGHARFPTDVSSPPGHSLAVGEPVVIEDLDDAAPEYRVHPVLLEHGVRSLLNVPVGRGSALWGVLEVDSDRPRAFEDAEVEFLEGLAGVLAGALDRYDLTERCERATAEAASREARAETLLREAGHRTKNNLQLAVAVISRERRAAHASGEPEERRAAERLGRVMERVSAVALAHDRLNAVAERDGGVEGAAGVAVDLAGYLRALLASLEVSHGGRIAVHADLDATVRLPFDKAVAAGLAVNELVTNAAKHAYPEEEQGGVVRVSLAADPTRAEATLAVADEGRGVVPDEAASRDRRNDGGGQGLGLVRQLARQLGGEAEAEPRPARGHAVTLRFPLVD